MHRIKSNITELFRGTCIELSKTSQENTRGRTLLLVKLKADCSGQLLYIKMARSKVFFQIIDKSVYSREGGILTMPEICFLETHISWNHIFFQSVLKEISLRVIPAKELFSYYVNLDCTVFKATPPSCRCM